MTHLIAGAGIGGLTAALTLHQNGQSAQLFDRAPELGEVGAGLQLAANASRVLIGLGLGPALEEVAFTPQAVELRTFDKGRLISTMPLGAAHVARYGAPYYHIHRGDLHRLLLDAVTARMGAGAVAVGRAVTGYEQADQSAALLFDDGTSEEGETVIGADGIHSAVRAQMLGDAQPNFTGHVAWRATIPVSRLKGVALDPVVTSWMAPHAHAVTYFVRGGEVLNFVGITETPDWTSESWTEAGDPAQLRAVFADWHPTIRAIVGAVETPFRWALYTRPALPRWSDGRVSLLGDACHPMLPYMAQGAGMAIEDAEVLARCLSAPMDTAAALATYQSVRLARTARVQQTAVSNGKLFHLANPVLRAMVYGGMKLGGMVLPSMVERRFDWLMSYDATSINVT